MAVRRSWGLVLCLGTVTLAGCGSESDDDDDDSETPGETSTPVEEGPVLVTGTLILPYALREGLPIYISFSPLDCGDALSTSVTTDGNSDTFDFEIELPRDRYRVYANVEVDDNADFESDFVGYSGSSTANPIYEPWNAETLEVTTAMSDVDVFVGEVPADDISSPPTFSINACDEDPDTAGGDLHIAGTIALPAPTQDFPVFELALIDEDSGAVLSETFYVNGSTSSVRYVVYGLRANMSFKHSTAVDLAGDGDYESSGDLEGWYGGTVDAPILDEEEAAVISLGATSLDGVDYGLGVLP